MTKVKICGIGEAEHALVAAQAGADFVGMVFASSKRQITPYVAKDIVCTVKDMERHPLTVGVFVNTPAEEVNRITRLSGLDLVQLSGDESWDYCLAIEKPIIKAIHVSDYESSREILSYLELGRKTLGVRPFILLLDSGGKGVYGGTGETFDWRMAGEVPKEFPVMLAGGLTPENVRKSIELAMPWGVDVSSGVETGGRKDILKIRAFVEAVRKVDCGIKASSP